MTKKSEQRDKDFRKHTRIMNYIYFNDMMF